MATPSPSEQQAAYAALSKLSARDLAVLWAKLNLGKPKTLADPLTEILDALTAKYGTAAASLAADWYDEARDAAGAAGRFTAITAPPPDADRLGALSRWGVAPLFGATPDGALALSLITGGLQRLVTGMGRQTTETSVLADPGQPMYARHASANACAFCRMLATRGAAYTSAQNAGRVTGESLGGKDYRKIHRFDRYGYTLSRESILQGYQQRTIAAGGRKGRATKQDIGDKYHDHCHCVPVAVWPGQTYSPPSYVDGWDDDYIAATKAVGSSDVSAVLSKMREISGAR